MKPLSVKGSGFFDGGGEKRKGGKGVGVDFLIF